MRPKKFSHPAQTPAFFSKIRGYLIFSPNFRLVHVVISKQTGQANPTGPHRLVVALKVVQPTAHVRQDLLQVRFEPFTLQLLDVVLVGRDPHGPMGVAKPP